MAIIYAEGIQRLGLAALFNYYYYYYYDYYYYYYDYD